MTNNYFKAFKDLVIQEREPAALIWDSPSWELLTTKQHKEMFLECWMHPLCRRIKRNGVNIVITPSGRELREND